MIDVIGIQPGGLKMQQCEVCGGRVMQTSEGHRCMNSQCEGSKENKQEGVICRQCGEPMHYRGLNSWGEPNYSCLECGATVKL